MTKPEIASETVAKLHWGFVHEVEVGIERRLQRKVILHNLSIMDLEKLNWLIDPANASDALSEGNLELHIRPVNLCLSAVWPGSFLGAISVRFPLCAAEFSHIAGRCLL